MDSGEPNSIGSSPGRYEAPIEFGSPILAYWTNGWPWFLLVTTNKTQIVIPDRELGRVNFLILSLRLAGGKNITEESVCFCSYVVSYGRWLGLQFWEVVGRLRNILSFFGLYNWNFRRSAGFRFEEIK
jgi:hypothetical protein